MNRNTVEKLEKALLSCMRHAVLNCRSTWQFANQYHTYTTLNCHHGSFEHEGQPRNAVFLQPFDACVDVPRKYKPSLKNDPDWAKDLVRDAIGSRQDQAGFGHDGDSLEKLLSFLAELLDAEREGVKILAADRGGVYYSRVGKNGTTEFSGTTDFADPWDQEWASSTVRKSWSSGEPR